MRDSSTINFAEYRARDGVAPRVLPQNIEAEQQLLGTLLINNDLLAGVSGFLKAEHFCEEIHRRIFAIASSMIVDGRLASPVTLKTFLGDHDVGGMTVPQYLAQLVTNAAPTICAADYARAVTDLASRREIIGVARAVIDQATDPPVDMKPTQVASEAIAAFQAIADAGDPAKVADGLLESARAIRAGEKTNAGVPTGLPDLDMRTGGFRPGELWVLGGRPGQGKTILATGFRAQSL